MSTKENEIDYYRKHVIGRYVDDVMKRINLDDHKSERINTYNYLMEKRA